ncbi:hypothetical protein [Eisenibacter elegans]|jgi:hypothetical protein|uniref:hypothetical protein n=1 Tax=Eisenibacter elegans TaxID=997 RepID=UPI00042286D9|nr:hypothetical protein [Eisenibacter elegans]
MFLFENESIGIYLSSENPCIVWMAKGFILGADFREGEEVFLTLYRRYRSEYPHLERLNDLRLMEGGISPEDTDWSAKVIMPQLAALGLSKEAFVMSEDFFTLLSVENYQESLSSIKTAFFKSEEEAFAWLSSVDISPTD